MNNPIRRSSDFFSVLPLYRTVSIHPDDGHRILDVIEFKGALDFYCPKCQQRSVFVSDEARCERDLNRPNYQVPFDSQSTSSVDNNVHVKRGEYTVRFYCSHRPEHVFYFHFLVEGANDEYEDFQITKIGQHPSAADLLEDELKKYRKALGGDYSEFSKAVGLAAHGVGIGSFVYLRRIFERLIEEAHQIATSDTGWSETSYLKAHMDEKVKLLELHLPSTLVTNRQMYSILSKGIHQLSEEECASYFDVLKTGIELILDEKIEQKERQTKAKALQVAVQKINGLLA